MSEQNKILAVGKAATEVPASYIRKLCKHWAHKLEVRYNEESGEIVFPMGYCELDARQPGQLLIRAMATDIATVQTLQDVITSHLQRFAVRETLQVEWEVIS